MDNLKQTLEIDVKVTPEQLAELFCSMDDKEQAIFFNTIYYVSQTWPVCNFDLQMLSAAKSDWLIEGGRNVMQTIGSMASNESDNDE